MTTLLALYRRPDGGPERPGDLRAALRRGAPAARRRRRPGLRDDAGPARVASALGGETDLILVTTMRFDDRAALDAGLASDAMRAAGRNLREIAPGLATLLVLEDAPELDSAAVASPAVDTVGTTAEDAVTDPAPSSAPRRCAQPRQRAALVRVAFPAPAPASAAPATTLPASRS